MDSGSGAGMTDGDGGGVLDGKREEEYYGSGKFWIFGSGLELVHIRLASR